MGGAQVKVFQILIDRRPQMGEYVSIQTNNGLSAMKTSKLESILLIIVMALSIYALEHARQSIAEYKASHVLQIQR
jgi:hypothetical protein